MRLVYPMNNWPKVYTMEKKIACLEKKSVKEVGLVVEEAEVEVEEEVVLPGFRFHPTDEELVSFYLRRKMDNKPISIEVIKEIDIYKYDPWDLPRASTVSGEKEWYFFCLRGRKYRNSIRPNRVTGSGFWKATGIDRPIYPADNANDCIGLKKSLVYYRGSAGKGTKTDWMMHEFRLPSNNKDNETSSPSMQEAEIWTICRIFKRNVLFKKYQGCKQQTTTTTTKQISPTDSGSKTSSFESDTSDEYQYLGRAGVHQQGEWMTATNYLQERNQLHVGQWINPAAVVPTPWSTTLTHPGINATQSPNTSEFLKDGSWDELGRIMECYNMMDYSLV